MVRQALTIPRVLTMPRALTVLQARVPVDIAPTQGAK